MPAVRFELHPATVAEARAARNWYAERNEGAADAFMTEVDRAIALIAGHPDRWPSHRFGTRRVLLRRFPFAPIFRRDAETVTVFAVVHSRRRPGYWQNRLQR